MGGDPDRRDGGTRVKDPSGKGGNVLGTRVFKGESWQPTCACPTAPLKRAVVLDPFSGSGTTASVATSLNRNAVGLDLNPEYLPLARARVMGVAAPSQEQGDSAPLDALTELFGGD